VLELVGVVVTQRGVPRLDRCSFEVRAGEVLGLVGGTGAGKTAALEVMAGLQAPQQGRVVLDGRDATRAGRRLRAAAGLVAHTCPGPGDVSVSEWLRLWGRLDGADPKASTAAAERFGVPDGARLVGTLSQGQRLRLGLARLWARAPQVYLLDAPEAGLDGDGLRRLSEAVRDAAAGGSTVVLTAAAPYLPSAVCDRVICMAAGAATAEASRGAPDFEVRIAAAQGWSS
jgi:ABC-type multidrug transport system ATPase subunit